MSELTIEGVESALILHFPKTRTQQQLEATLDIGKELAGYPHPTVMAAQAHARDLMGLGMKANDAARRAINKARGAVREPEEV